MKLEVVAMNNYQLRIINQLQISNYELTIKQNIKKI